MTHRLGCWYFILSQTHLLLTTLLLTVLMHESFGKYCKYYSAQYNLITADCAYQYLSDVPNNLNSKVEVLDLSYNLIHTLHNDSFTCCNFIKLLYLQSNPISTIEWLAFAPLPSLRALDLSKTSLNEMPGNLPSNLVKLYLKQVPALYGMTVIDLSGLTYLDTLDLSSNQLSSFPEFTRSMPSLVELNIMDNKITTIMVDHLTSLCRLKYLRVSTDKLFQVPSESHCPCFLLKTWVSEHEIEIAEFSCNTPGQEETECSNLKKQVNESSNIYQKCLDYQYQAEGETNRNFYKWIFSFCGLAMILLILFYLQSQKRRRYREKVRRDPRFGKHEGNKSKHEEKKKFENVELKNMSPNADYAGEQFQSTFTLYRRSSSFTK